MIAVDTNVLVRLLTEDDAEQTRRAAALFRKHHVFVPETVLLETEWVLRYVYGLRPRSIDEAFRKLLGLSEVSVEDPGAVAEALDGYAQGLDFADALHLASSGGSEGFAAFDEDLARKGRSLSPPMRVVSR